MKARSMRCVGVEVSRRGSREREEKQEMEKRSDLSRSVGARSAGWEAGEGGRASAKETERSVCLLSPAAAVLATRKSPPTSCFRFGPRSGASQVADLEVISHVQLHITRSDCAHARHLKPAPARMCRRRLHPGVTYACPCNHASPGGARADHIGLHGLLADARPAAFRPTPRSFRARADVQRGTQHEGGRDA